MPSADDQSLWIFGAYLQIVLTAYNVVYLDKMSQSHLAPKYRWKLFLRPLALVKKTMATHNMKARTAIKSS